MVEDMEKDDKRENKVFDETVKGVRDFKVWTKLLELGFEIVDVNKDKCFVCPYFNKKCTFKSVLYFKRTEEFDEVLKKIYQEIENEKETNDKK
jgi:hypothetical protein